MRILAVVFISALAALSPTGLLAQTSGTSNGVKELGDLTDQIAAFQKRGHKGWTCRDPEDGKRMHRLDPTNVARMGKIRSSEQGFLDTKTPVESLPVCTEPQ